MTTPELPTEIDIHYAIQYYVLTGKTRKIFSDHTAKKCMDTVDALYQKIGQSGVEALLKGDMVAVPRLCEKCKGAGRILITVPAYETEDFTGFGHAPQGRFATCECQKKIAAAVKGRE